MRIDLIPEITAEAEKGQKKHLIIAPPTRKHKRIDLGTAKEQTTRSPYDELLQSIYDAALISDIHGKITDVNVRAMDFFMYERQELTGLMIYDVISGANESLIQTLLENLMNERFTLIQAYCVRKDGSFFPAEIAVNELRLGGTHLCFFIRDVTLRRQSDEMLRTEHNAIQNSSNGIAIANLNGELEYVNPAVVRLWGYDNDAELVGKDVCGLCSNMEGFRQMITSVMETQQSWNGEMGGKKKNGDEFDVQVSAVCNRDSDGATVGVVLSLTDISDRKRAEEATREAERHKVMLESLGAACHHLGQPATVLLANLGIMQKKLEGANGDVKELLDASLEAAESLGQILHKLNTVNEYKTTRYLDRAEGADSAENRILEI